MRYVRFLINVNKRNTLSLPFLFFPCVFLLDHGDKGAALRKCSTCIEDGENVTTYSARKKIWHGKNTGTSPPLRMRWPYISQNARRIQVNAVSEVQSDVGTHQGAEDEIWETAGVAPSV